MHTIILLEMIRKEEYFLSKLMLPRSLLDACQEQWRLSYGMILWSRFVQAILSPSQALLLPFLMFQFWLTQARE